MRTRTHTLHTHRVRNEQSFACVLTAAVARAEHTMEVKFDITDSMNGSTYGMQLNGSFVPATQLHFHSPSEHTFNGVHYPLEMHIVNQPVNMATLAGGVPAAVIAILFEYTCVAGTRCSAWSRMLCCTMHRAACYDAVPRANLLLLAVLLTRR